MNRLFRWGIFIACIVLAASGYIIIKTVFGESMGGVTVPNVVNLSSADATNQLHAIGLAARIDETDSNSPKGIVLSQSIPPGELTDRGKTVILKTSRGGVRINIPDVRNKEYPTAVQELEAAGLKVGATIRVADQIKQPNVVIAQNPAAPASVINNRMVDLLVSEGGAGRNESVQVPDLRGETEAHARQILEQSYLDVSKVLTQTTAQYAEGTVVRTDPRAGARVQTGRAVALYLAKAPDPNAPPPPPKQPDQLQPAPNQPNTDRVNGQANETSTWDPDRSPQVNTSAQKPDPPKPQPAPIPPIPTPSSGKVAKVRYQVPPLARPLDLVISISDRSGTKTLRQQQANGLEHISLDVPYTGSATVTVKLGNQQVWQEKFN